MFVRKPLDFSIPVYSSPIFPKILLKINFLILLHYYKINLLVILFDSRMEPAITFNFIIPPYSCPWRGGDTFQNTQPLKLCYEEWSTLAKRVLFVLYWCWTLRDLKIYLCFPGARNRDSPCWPWPQIPWGQGRVQRKKELPRVKSCLFL